ncbi:hypothetical protein E2562_012813 [Oryza meyeriana var. granulata]|uniref:Uncharacterized protein n=1 Tax=Oryza meyeriana var. granulata TaxID=110450 RepID=A0A6G1DGT8_9ORYZ|nr:hypothetical protein E2562_012813 [Oryza meyeriana var. granulata]
MPGCARERGGARAAARRSLFPGGSAPPRLSHLFPLRSLFPVRRHTAAAQGVESHVGGAVGYGGGGARAAQGGGGSLGIGMQVRYVASYIATVLGTPKKLTAGPNVLQRALRRLE